MNADVAESGAPTEPRPLPGLQAEMAHLVVDGSVAFAAGTATWYEGPEAGDVAVKARGRTLRELLRSGVIAPMEGRTPDLRGAVPMQLTELGRSRYRPPAGDDAR